MSDQLLPCPFCGSNHLELDCGSVTESLGGFYLQSGEIECMKCGGSGPSVDASNEKDDLNALAASAWNTRAPQAASDSVTISRDCAEAMLSSRDSINNQVGIISRNDSYYTELKQALKA